MTKKMTAEELENLELELYSNALVNKAIDSFEPEEREEGRLELIDKLRTMQMVINSADSLLTTCAAKLTEQEGEISRLKAQVSSLTTALDSTDEDVVEYITEVAQLRAQIAAADDILLCWDEGRLGVDALFESYRLASKGDK